MNNGRISAQKYEGVFYRESVKRQYNGAPDRSFAICYNHLGKKYWKTLGWASQGMTAPKAYKTRLEILARLSQGESPRILNRTQHYTVDQVVFNYLQQIKDSTPAKGYKNKIYCYRQYIQPYCGEMLIDQLDFELLQKMQTDCSKTLSRESVNKVFQVLSTAINYAIKTKTYRAINPLTKAAGFNRLVPDNKGERFLTPEEARLLLKTLKDRSKTWHDIALLALHSGLRLTEITKIRGQDISENSRTVMVTAKGGKREPVLLDDMALQTLLENQTGPTELVFQNACGTKIKSAYQTHFAAAVKELGFNDGVTDRRYRVWFHTLRHTFASWLAQEGVDIYALMKLMRHRNIEMTQRYAHLIPDKQRDHLAFISKKISNCD